MRLIKSTQNKAEPKLIEASYEDLVIIMIFHPAKQIRHTERNINRNALKFKNKIMMKLWISMLAGTGWPLLVTANEKDSLPHSLHVFTENFEFPKQICSFFVGEFYLMKI